MQTEKSIAPATCEPQGEIPGIISAIESAITYQRGLVNEVEKALEPVLAYPCLEEAEGCCVEDVLRSPMGTSLRAIRRAIEINTAILRDTKNRICL